MRVVVDFLFCVMCMDRYGVLVSVMYHIYLVSSLAKNDTQDIV